MGGEGKGRAGGEGEEKKARIRITVYCYEIKETVKSDQLCADRGYSID